VLSRSGDQDQAGEVAATQGARIVHRQVGEQRHAVILDLPVADQALLASEWCSTSGRSRNSQCEEMHGARKRLTKDRYLLRFS
jgi:hypothetical protein